MDFISLWNSQMYNILFLQQQFLNNSNRFCKSDVAEFYNFRYDCWNRIYFLKDLGILFLLIISNVHVIQLFYLASCKWCFISSCRLIVTSETEIIVCICGEWRDELEKKVHIYNEKCSLNIYLIHLNNKWLNEVTLLCSFAILNNFRLRRIFHLENTNSTFPTGQTFLTRTTKKKPLTFIYDKNMPVKI